MNTTPNHPDVGEAPGDETAEYVNLPDAEVVAWLDMQHRKALASGDTWSYEGVAAAKLRAARLSPPALGGDAVLVPREPTDEMLEQACIAAGYHHGNAQHDLQIAWAAMLAAAPAPAVAAGCERHASWPKPWLCGKCQRLGILARTPAPAVLEACPDHLKYVMCECTKRQVAADNPSPAEAREHHANCNSVLLGVRCNCWLSLPEARELAGDAPAVEREANGVVLDSNDGPYYVKVKWRGVVPVPGTLVYTTPPAEAREPVGDAMVEAGAAGLWHSVPGRMPWSVAVANAAEFRDAARAVLTATLAQPQATPRDSGDAKNAARYLWLKANAINGSIGLRGNNWLNCDEPEAEWDDAIDAAMQSPTGEPT